MRDTENSEKDTTDLVDQPTFQSRTDDMYIAAMCHDDKFEELRGVGHHHLGNLAWE